MIIYSLPLFSYQRLDGDNGKYSRVKSVLFRVPRGEFLFYIFIC